MADSQKKQYAVYWHKENRSPIILDVFAREDIAYGDTVSYMAVDIRPVFLEEKFLLSQILPDVFGDVWAKSVWADKSSHFFIDGVKVKKSILQALKKFPSNILAEEFEKFNPSADMLCAEQDIINAFVKCNEGHLNKILHETLPDSEGWSQGAIPFIQEVVARNPNRHPFVSFSGGKDSTVVSHLVQQALSSPSIIHIFGDTTLEFPYTYEYVKRFQEKHTRTPFLLERNNESDFMSLCKKVGPPSRVKTWCCSIFKTGPMGTTLANMGMELLTFYGVRRHESASRSKYLRLTPSPKLEMQHVAAPIIDWYDVDVWLYILKNKLDFNKAYRLGFTRVGCWCCPNNSDWSDLLMAVHNSKHYCEWRGFLIDFAKKIGKPDAEVYIETGKWKARHGGDGLDVHTTKVNSKDCTVENNARQYTLTREMSEDFYEFFKPFGKLDFTLGKKGTTEVFVFNRNNDIVMKISGAVGGHNVRISFYPALKKLTASFANQTNIVSYIDKQIRKFQTCVFCQACNSICPVGALSVGHGTYKINESKCVHCLKCVTHFSSGCLIASALETKNEQ